MTKYTVNVKHQSTTTLQVEVEGTTTVGELKNLLSEKTSIPASEIKLIFKGKILKVEDDVLNDLQIVADSTIHMIQNKPASASETQPTNHAAAPQNPLSSQATGNQPPNFGAFPGFGGMGGMGGMGGLGGMGGMGGLGGMGGMGGMDMQQIQSMMSNPQVRAMAQQLMSNPQMMRQMIENNPMLSQMSQNIPNLDQMLSNPNLLDNIFPNAPQNPGQANANTNTHTATSTPNTGVPPNMPDFSSILNNPQFQQQFGNLGSMGFGGMAQPPADPNTNYEELYKNQLQALSDMGFTNKEVNIQVLKECYGNVDAAVERLLSMFK